MKNYLSFGGGVNSVALYLLMQDLGMNFEAIFVNHGGDWPETYEYVDYFIGTGRPITVLKPDVEGISSLVEYCKKHGMIPSRRVRWCTEKFKVKILHNYMTKPCWSHVGIDAGEGRRARLSSVDGVENRYLLIEHGIDREGCEQLIRNNGLSVPIKSGCWFCPFQQVRQWRKLRRTHPCLFREAVSMEEISSLKRAEKGKGPITFHDNKRFLSELVNENQLALPGLESEVEYPPCQCGL